MSRLAAGVFPQVVEIVGKTFSSDLRPMFEVLEQRRPPNSYAWGCPRCGEIWARAKVANRPWQFIHHVCESCIDDLIPTYTIPGSIYLSWDAGFNSSLGEALWLRELELHIKHVERIGEIA